MSDYLRKPIKITVCADGFVSIMRTAKDRRQKAALPCYSVNEIHEAIVLIGKVCHLRACEHGGKTGTLIEPWAPNWPLYGSADVEHIYQLGELFAFAERDMGPVA